MTHLIIAVTEPAYCDACTVARARSRFTRPATWLHVLILDMCDHHAYKHRAQLAAAGWHEYALSQPEDIP